MTFVAPRYSKSQVNRAGDILAAEDETSPSWGWAYDVLTNWRGCHGYPINTFQATLRSRLKSIDTNAIVAQRLKRAPSIISKLQRFDTMKLARMQDIGGLRAIVGSVPKVHRIERTYRKSRLFKHDLVSSKDYIAVPKGDGYRSVHLVFKYKNERAPEYDDLLIELQLRTRLQHAWATGVETMGTFLGQALKAGQGTSQWRHFFVTCSAAIAHIEKTPPVAGFEEYSRAQLMRAVADEEQELNVMHKLQSFAIAADHITKIRGSGSYHLIILDTALRTVTIRPYPVARLEQANADYAQVEERAQRGEKVEAVLVSAGPVEAMMKAYPNYFLDTRGFVGAIQAMINEAA